jgi:tetratricopeptide (TPR) repeat protein
VDRDDSLAAAWTLLGQAYAEQQEWDQAILAFQEALALDPDQYEANHDLAKVQALRKAWDRVIDLESRALAAAPDDRRWAESALTLLQAYEAVGAHEETCRLLEQLSERLRDPALDVRIATIWDCTSTP